MIPRHSLPFGVREILSGFGSHTPTTDSTDLEKAYADTLGVRAVILLPSVRAGIHMTIRATSEPGRILVGPAYTCDAVHEALALSGADIRLVDSAPDAFLMPPEGIFAASEPGCALVLSEVYGIPYDKEMLQMGYRKGPRVRILDLAMSIAAPERMQQLGSGDVALYSFGWGKPMYAGWGGIACFQDPELAGRVREIRDRWCAQESFSLRFWHSSCVLLRVSMNQRHIYGLLHERRLYHLYKALASLLNKACLHPKVCDSAPQLAPGQATQALPSKWTRPTTPLNRRLALHNLCHSRENADLRCCQAEMYSKCLVESGIVRGPGSKTLPQSHFPIRIPPAVRDAMCDYLRGRGIDTSTLFSFPVGLSQGRYPHSAKAAKEVVTLPLGPSITSGDVKRVSKCVKGGLRELGL